MKIKFAFVFILFSIRANAQLRLPAVLSSNMVLQQNDSVWLWGLANPAEKVFITTGWDGHKDSAVTSEGAQWKLKVKTPSAGGPYTITFNNTWDTIRLTNVMVGEVWLCSGQSNMDWNYWVGVNDMQPELDLDKQNNIRFFYIAKATSEYPQDDTRGQWEVCDSGKLKSFSAVAYFFAKRLQMELNIPIGLIQSSWSGTPAEVWMPAAKTNSNDILKNAAGKLPYAIWWPITPGLAYNAMLHPVINYSIAGAIWYQGEGNVAAPATYNLLFSTMIDYWRQVWKKNFPLYYVQIAPYAYGEPYQGSVIREQQALASKNANVGMITITDLVNDTADIHPKNKKDVGYRLANWALAETYHKDRIVYKSPSYEKMEVVKNKAMISFSNIGGGIVSKGSEITELLVAGEDKIFYPAEAKIENNVLVVWSKKVKAPAAVRFAFRNAAIGNLFNKEGLPLTPFRTDNWELK